MKNTHYDIDGYSLTVEHIIQAVRGELGMVGLEPAAKARCDSSREQITRCLGRMRQLFMV